MYKNLLNSIMSYLDENSDKYISISKDKIHIKEFEIDLNNLNNNSNNYEFNKMLETLEYIHNNYNTVEEYDYDEYMDNTDMYMDHIEHNINLQGEVLPDELPF